MEGLGSTVDIVERLCVTSSVPAEGDPNRLQGRSDDLARAAAARRPGQALFAPCDAPPDRWGTLTVVAAGGRAPDWLGALVEAVARVPGVRVRLLVPDIPPSAGEVGADATAAVEWVAGLDVEALRAEAFRASGVVLVDHGQEATSAGTADRHAAEAAATGAAVVGYDPDGRREVGGRSEFGSLVTDEDVLVRTARFLLSNPEMAERAGAKALRQAHPGRPAVSAVLATIRPQRLADAVRTVDAQHGVDVELVVVGHGFEPDAATVAGALDGGAVRDVKRLQVATELSLGEVLNVGFAAGDAPLLAKVDDDDLYGSHYLQEQTLAIGYSGAQIVGKWSWHVHLSMLDVTVLRRPGHEHVTQPHVSGATMVMTREAFAANPFPDRVRGSDIALLQGAEELGLTVYATSRFNFIAVRHPAGHGHTWRADDLVIATRGDDDRARFVGLATEQVFV